MEDCAEGCAGVPFAVAATGFIGAEGLAGGCGGRVAIPLILLRGPGGGAFVGLCGAPVVGGWAARGAVGGAGLTIGAASATLGR